MIIITGGAGVIGLDTALQFREKGAAEAVLIDINKKALDKIQEQYGIKGLACNLTNKKMVSQYFKPGF